jgi:hypothetical protein
MPHNQNLSHPTPTFLNERAGRLFFLAVKSVLFFKRSLADGRAEGRAFFLGLVLSMPCVTPLTAPVQNQRSDIIHKDNKIEMEDMA